MCEHCKKNEPLTNGCCDEVGYIMCGGRIERPYMNIKACNYMGEQEDEHIEINYCPMCGRKLKTDTLANNCKNCGSITFDNTDLCAVCKLDGLTIKKG